MVEKPKTLLDCDPLPLPSETPFASVPPRLMPPEVMLAVMSEKLPSPGTLRPPDSASSQPPSVSFVKVGPPVLGVTEPTGRL